MHFTWNTHQPIQASGVEQRIFSDGLSRYVWAKGYFFDSDGRMWYGAEIVDWLSRELPGTSLRALLPYMNGCFAILIADPQTCRVELGADRIATVPLFVHATSNVLMVSDDYWSIVRSIDTPRYDALGLTGMFLMGHTLGPRTMIETIQTLPPACVLSFSIGDRIIRSQDMYWTNEFSPRKVTDYNLLRQRAADMLQRVFGRYARAAQQRNWTVTVPLSGGLDSRLAAGLMHQGGARMQAFSYGPESYAEVKTAQQVAKALEIPFRTILTDDPDLMTPELIELQTQSIGMLARFTTGFGARIAVQGYDPNAVFVTGHPANLPTGQATPRGATLLRNPYQNARMILNNFGLPISDDTLRRLMPKTYNVTQKYLCFADGPVFYPDDPMASYEHWTYYFHSTCLLLLELRVYEDFGNWFIPYLDYELIDFYNDVPLRYRFPRRLHVDAIVNHVFTGKLAPLQEILISGKSRLQAQEMELRDLVWMSAPPSGVGDVLLQRQNNVQRQVHERGRGRQVQHAWGPDPIDYWWQKRPAFREKVLAELRDWDGMGGLVDVEAVQQVLQEPMHPNFIRFGVAVLLTLKTFQRLVETSKQYSAA